jgi:hypothetical protein
MFKGQGTNNGEDTLNGEGTFNGKDLAEAPANARHGCAEDGIPLERSPDS